MLITIAILVAVLCGYGLGIHASRKYHRRVESELIAQVRDTVCNEIFEIAKQAQAKRIEQSEHMN